jgi:hypothetical protein
MLEEIEILNEELRFLHTEAHSNSLLEQQKQLIQQLKTLLDASSLCVPSYQ